MLNETYANREKYRKNQIFQRGLLSHCANFMLKYLNYEVMIFLPYMKYERRMNNKIVGATSTLHEFWVHGPKIWWAFQMFLKSCWYLHPLHSSWKKLDKKNCHLRNPFCSYFFLTSKTNWKCNLILNQGLKILKLPSDENILLKNISFT